MATLKVGIYRKWLEPVPNDGSGKPLPKTEWTKKRRHNWLVRWTGTTGKSMAKFSRQEKPHNCMQ